MDGCCLKAMPCDCLKEMPCGCLKGMPFGKEKRKTIGKLLLKVGKSHTSHLAKPKNKLINFAKLLLSCKRSRKYPDFLVPD